MTTETVARQRRNAEAAARERLDALAKPPGSLGRLEDLAVRLAGIAGTCPPPIPNPAVVAVFAADHGVTASGVTPWPSSVTAAVARTLVAGTGGVSVLARSVGASVTVVDVGLLAPVPGTVDRAVRRGTANLAVGPAMSLPEARVAVDVGTEVAAELTAAGARCLVMGEVGIGNTTASSALVAVLAGRPAAEVTGSGSGADAGAVARKREVVATAAARAAVLGDPLEVLAEVGGLEIAALAGLVLGGSAARVPVVVDGAIAATAALVATRLDPAAQHCLVAGHRSPEPASSVALDALGLEPLLDLGLRLGEGSGAVLALPLLEAAARLLTEMSTLDEALAQ